MIRRKTDPTMKRVHLHSPITIEFNETTTYSIAPDGMVTISVIDSEDPTVEDRITIPAYLIFKIGASLNITRRSIKNVPREIKNEVE